MKRKLLCIISLLPFISLAQNPITTSASYTPQQLVNDILLDGTGITATNITSVSASDFGNLTSLGYFNSGGDFALQDGIVLSTGDISAAPGPNTGTQSAGVGGWMGDADVLAVMLEIGAGSTSTINATKLEFDFTAVSNQFSMDYIFASEEYGTFQCNYSDAFVILLTDLGTNTSQNLAVIPGTTTPVTVVTVRDNAYNINCTSMNAAYFGEYYADGNNAPINFNGQTVSMSAQAVLVPGNNYHLKIAIADRNDPVFDSALFIERINASVDNITNAGTPDDLYACDENLDGVAVFDLTQNDAAILDGQDAADFTVNYFETLAGAEDNDISVMVSDAEAYYNISPYSQTIYARLTNNTDESYDTVSFEIMAAPVPEAGETEELIVMDTDTDGMAMVDLTTLETVILNGFDPALFEVSYYQSEMNAENGAPALSVPQSYMTPSATVYFRLENTETGCYDIDEIEVVVLPADYETPAPEGDDEQEFEDGDTLADLEVEGDDIQWYDNAGQTGPPSTTDTDTPLPMNTVLVDGVTYYASQTVYGIESVQRLAVTAHSTMGTEESAFAGFSHFPNPVKDVLHISNDTIIDNVAIYNIVGQLVQANKISADNAGIDLQSLSKGIYIVKVRSGNAEKAIRIIKE